MSSHLMRSLGAAVLPWFVVVVVTLAAVAGVGWALYEIVKAVS